MTLVEKNHDKYYFIWLLITLLFNYNKNNHSWSYRQGWVSNNNTSAALFRTLKAALHKRQNGLSKGQF